MNWLDWVLVVSLAVSFFWGLRQGFIGAFIPLVGLILGVFLAGRLYLPLAERLFGSDAAIARIGAFLIILAAVGLVASLVARVLTRLVSLVMLGLVNRLAGGAFGLVMGGVSLGALLAFVARFPLLGLEAAVKDSSLAAFLVSRIPLVLSLLPGEFDFLRSFFE
ncbi:MAG: CvpA family protein [Chloroflexota bacterium]